MAARVMNSHPCQAYCARSSPLLPRSSSLLSIVLPLATTMVHSTASLPGSFVSAQDKVNLPPPAAIVSLPVIDLSRDRDEVRRAILDAGKEFGFFQVVNHGVPEQAMREMEAVCKEFFALPAADKAAFYSEDRSKPNRFFSGSSYETGGNKFWMDCLRLECDGDSSNDWPEKPQRLWEVVEKFTKMTMGMGREVLQLLCEGMGLRPDYLEGDLSDHVVFTLNHYPACPDPSTMLGLPAHVDRELLVLLLPGTVPGLEVSYNGDWILVEPVPNTFVVNFGLPLEIVTNGLLKSIEHRVVTNTAMARTSIGSFIWPTMDCIIGPAEEFLGGDPPRYRTVTYRELRSIINIAKPGSMGLLVPDRLDKNGEAAALAGTDQDDVN